MKALTIKELKMFVDDAIRKGHEDYVVFVTNDEEANGYHALWYLGETPATMSETTREFVEDNNCDLSVLEDKNKAYYLG